MLKVVIIALVVITVSSCGQRTPAERGVELALDTSSSAPSTAIDSCSYPCIEWPTDARARSGFVDNLRSDMEAAARMLAQQCAEEFSKTATCPDFTQRDRGLAYAMPVGLVWRSICVADTSASRCFVVATADAEARAGDFFGQAVIPKTSRSQ